MRSAKEGDEEILRRIRFISSPSSLNWFGLPLICGDIEISRRIILSILLKWLGFWGISPEKIMSGKKIGFLIFTKVPGVCDFLKKFLKILFSRARALKKSSMKPTKQNRCIGVQHMNFWRVWSVKNLKVDVRKAVLRMYLKNLWNFMKLQPHLVTSWQEEERGLWLCCMTKEGGTNPF